MVPFEPVRKLPLSGWHSPRPNGPEGALNSEEAREGGVFAQKKQKKIKIHISIYPEVYLPRSPLEIPGFAMLPSQISRDQREEQGEKRVRVWRAGLRGSA